MHLPPPSSPQVAPRCNFHIAVPSSRPQLSPYPEQKVLLPPPLIRKVNWHLLAPLPRARPLPTIFRLLKAKTWLSLARARSLPTIYRMLIAKTWLLLARITYCRRLRWAQPHEERPQLLKPPSLVQLHWQAPYLCLLPHRLAAQASAPLVV